MTNKKDDSEYKRQMQKANAKGKYRDLSAAAKAPPSVEMTFVAEWRKD
jgi:hypothetical protein